MTSYKRILDASPFAYVVMDPQNGEIIYANPQFRRLWNLANAHYISRITDIPDFPLFLIQDAHFDSTVLPQDFLLQDGRVIRRYLSLIQNWEGHPEVNVYVFQDITGSTEDESLRLTSDSRLKDFAQAIPDICFIEDEDGRYIEVYGSNQKILSMPKEDHIGRTLYEVHSEDQADLMLKLIRRSLATGEQQFLSIQRKIGNETKYFEGRVAPMTSTFQGKRTVVVVVTDVTERKNAENALQFAYELRRKSDFLNELINGHMDFNPDLQNELKEWGIDLSRPVFCCLVDVGAGKTESQEKNKKREDARYIIQNLIHFLNQSTAYTIWDRQKNIGLFIQVQDEPVTTANSIAIAEEIRNKIARYDPAIKVAIGIGNPQTGLNGLRKTFREAQKALLSILSGNQKNADIVHYAKLGFFKLLTTNEQNEQDLEYVQSAIGKLIQYDLQKGTNLLNTLEVILYSNDLKGAAKQLSIHYQTLIFRKKRIEKVLEVCLDEFETRLTLAAAVKLYKMIKMTSA